jgi:hypothetical protein
MDYRVEPRRRVVGHAEFIADRRATEGGLTVPEMEPNFSGAVLFTDAGSGEPVLANLPLDVDDARDLRQAVRKIEYGETIRQSTGLRNRSRTFGMSPRKLYQKRESCRPSALSTDQPDVHAVLVALGAACGRVLEDLAPEVLAHDRIEMEAVEQEWRLYDRSTWTSGVVNNTTVLPYHVDGFNFPTWSAMPVLRRGVRGGFLHVPEYDLVVPCRDGWAVYFCGHDLWHGVTPLRVVEPDGYRMSVVYYSLRGMKDCFTYAVESAEGAKRRTAREEGLAAAARGDRPLAFEA